MGENYWKTRSQLDDVRRAERLSVAIEASIREHGTTKFQVKVIDLSITGFRCETSFTLHPGTRVWLTLPGFGGLEATVAWRNKYLYGFAFDQPLHPAVFNHIQSKYGAEGRGG